MYRIIAKPMVGEVRMKISEETLIPLSAIKPYERNAKKHPKKEIKRLMESIRDYGWTQPIVIDEHNLIIIGHGRRLAAIELGITEVPCKIYSGLTEKQKKTLRLADNKTNESKWIEAFLALDLSELDEMDMSRFGFEMDTEESKANASKKLYEEMQLKAFEHYDYVVFVFKSQHDWLNVVSHFDLQKVNAGYGETKKVGVGRVLDGKRLLKIIGYSDTDIEPVED